MQRGEAEESIDEGGEVLGEVGEAQVEGEGPGQLLEESVGLVEEAGHDGRGRAERGRALA